MIISKWKSIFLSCRRPLPSPTPPCLEGMEPGEGGRRETAGRKKGKGNRGKEGGWEERWRGGKGIRGNRGEDCCTGLVGGERWKWHSLGLALALSASAFKICLFYQVGYINVFSLSLSLSLFFLILLPFFSSVTLSLSSLLFPPLSLSLSRVQKTFSL